MKPRGATSGYLSLFFWRGHGIWAVFLLFLCFLGLDGSRAQHRIANALDRNGVSELFLLKERYEERRGRLTWDCARLLPLQPSAPSHAPVSTCDSLDPPLPGVVPGQTVTLGRSPDYPDAVEYLRGDIRNLARSNGGLARFILWVVALPLTLWSLSWPWSAALATRAGTAVWMRLEKHDAGYLYGKRGGSLFFRLMHPPTGTNLRTGPLYHLDYVDRASLPRVGRGLLCYRSPLLGRTFWEGELPGFAPPLTRFPGAGAAWDSLSS